MDLYLIRHAEAIPRGSEDATPDEERPLTDQGIAQARLLAEVLRQRQIALELVVTSPLVRAHQTAERFLEAWGDSAPALEVCPRLAPGGKRRKLAAYLSELHKQSVAVVGHEPDLGEFTAWLIGSRKAQVKLEKGGIALVQTPTELEKGSGTLVWLVTQAWLEGAPSA